VGIAREIRDWLVSEYLSIQSLIGSTCNPDNTVLTVRTVLAQHCHKVQSPESVSGSRRLISLRWCLLEELRHRGRAGGTLTPRTTDDEVNPAPEI
jgi:hypothetical protein